MRKHEQQDDTEIWRKKQKMRKYGGKERKERKGKKARKEEVKRGSTLFGG